jgi:hypothetical protein
MTGTPIGPPSGTPPTGGRFEILSVDVRAVTDGGVARAGAPPWRGDRPSGRRQVESWFSRRGSYDAAWAREAPIRVTNRRAPSKYGWRDRRSIPSSIEEDS